MSAERESLFAGTFRHVARRVCEKARWWSWKLYGNVRWYWPRAQARRRVLARFQEQIEAMGEDWPTYRRESLPKKPWWLP